MKRKIRYGMWETNSSSCHSVCISKHKLMNFAMPTPDPSDNFLHVTFGEFGWEVHEYNDPLTKLKYALTMVAMVENPKNEDEFYETEGFKAIDEVVKNKLNCNGVVVEDDFAIQRWESTRTGKYYEELEIDGYIDHQSCEDYNSLQDFLNDYDVTLEDFIFNSDVILKTDNDNY